MLTLSYGFKKPENTDTADVWRPALEANFQQLNDHNHDGANSAPLAVTTQTALAANWVAYSGSYRQIMTVPAGMTFDGCDIWVRTSVGVQIYPKIEKVSATTFYVYTDDNTLEYSVKYR